MSRYFFHLHENGTIVADQEGRALDRTALRDSAIRDARYILSNDILEGRISLDGCIVVEDEQRREVVRVPFREAVTIGGG